MKEKNVLCDNMLLMALNSHAGQDGWLDWLLGLWRVIEDMIPLLSQEH